MVHLPAGDVLPWNRAAHLSSAKVQRSLRDVEPTVNLWLRTPDGLEVERGGDG